MVFPETGVFFYLPPGCRIVSATKKGGSYEENTLDKKFHPGHRGHRARRRRGHCRRLRPVLFGLRRDRQHPGFGAHLGHGAHPLLPHSPFGGAVDGSHAPQALPGGRRRPQRPALRPGGAVPAHGAVFLCGLPGLLPASLHPGRLRPAGLQLHLPPADPGGHGGKGLRRVIHALSGAQGGDDAPGGGALRRPGRGLDAPSPGRAVSPGRGGGEPHPNHRGPPGLRPLLLQALVGRHPRGGAVFKGGAGTSQHLFLHGRDQRRGRRVRAAAGRLLSYGAGAQRHTLLPLLRGGVFGAEPGRGGAVPPAPET